MRDDDHEAGEAGQLTAELQKAALNLIKHLRTTNFRVRIEGTVPAVYITLGEGRSSYSADSIIFDGPQAQAPGAPPSAAQAAARLEARVAAHDEVQETAQRTPLRSWFSGLRKALAA